MLAHAVLPTKEKTKQNLMKGVKRRKMSRGVHRERIDGRKERKRKKKKGREGKGREAGREKWEQIKERRK